MLGLSDEEYYLVSPVRQFENLSSKQIAVAERLCKRGLMSRIQEMYEKDGHIISILAYEATAIGKMIYYIESALRSGKP